MSTHLVSVGPPPELEQSRDPFLFTRVATLLAKKAPGILQKTVQFASRKYANQPADFMRQIMIYKSESDLAYVNDTDLASHSYTAWLEGSRQTECLMAVEELRIRAEPWQIDFSAIECPVHIWHSRNDPQAPFARLETMLARIQDVRLHIIDDDSTMTWYHKWQDIIASVGKQSEAPV